MKKAQITVFIIIGVLVIIAFGITFYVGTKMSQRIEGKETQQRLEQIGIQPIQDYVTTCLSLATTEALSLIGRQGGALYQKQYGLTKDYIEGEGEFYVKYTDPQLGILDVSYLVLPPTGNVGNLFFSDPPEYPFPGFPYPAGETKPLFTGYYGTSKLPPLYKTLPTDKPCTKDEDCQPDNCKDNFCWKTVQESLQENLETFIARKTTTCANWQTFEDKGYQITSGTAIANILFAEKQQVEKFIEAGAFGEQQITIELLWPIEIATPGGDKTIIKDFAIKIPVRLVTIYYTVKTMIDGDVTDISFKPTGTGAFTTTTIPYGYDSFIILKDTQSTVANKPFEFWIPRKNRRPALWQIGTEALKDVTLHVTPEGKGTRLRIIKISDEESQLQFDDPCPEGQLPYLTLKASDPDEDEIKYSIHVPGSTTDEIPLDATTFGEYSITIFAKDRSVHPDNWFDSQEIPLQVALCEIR
jgi:hypothetical protein